MQKVKLEIKNPEEQMFNLVFGVSHERLMEISEQVLNIIQGLERHSLGSVQINISQILSECVSVCKDINEACILSFIMGTIHEAAITQGVSMSSIVRDSIETGKRIIANQN